MFTGNFGKLAHLFAPVIFVEVVESVGSTDSLSFFSAIAKLMGRKRKEKIICKHEILSPNNGFFFGGGGEGGLYVSTLTKHVLNAVAVGVTVLSSFR